MIIAPSTVVLFVACVAKSQFTSPAFERSIRPLLLRSCQAARRTRSLRTAESMVIVIVPLDGIAWLRRRFVAVIGVPLTAVMKTCSVPTLFAVGSWMGAEKPDEASAVRMVVDAA